MIIRSDRAKLGSICLFLGMPNQRDDLPLEDILMLIGQLETQMKEVAKKLEFEEASMSRDRIKHFRDRLLGKNKAPFKRQEAEA